MKVSNDRFVQRLGVVLGIDAVTTQPSDLAVHAVDGTQPALVCAPQSAEQIAAAIRLCSECDAVVIPWGGATAMAVGNPPARAEVIVDLKKLNRLIEHDHANLTATVQSGMPLTALQVLLAPQKQFVPFDPPFPDCSTIGGIVAASLNGPRRGFYGGVRDLVIGMKVVLASGEQIKAGGKVVKNVAGYDLCKLFVGSFGTLGIITEVTLRMAPIPETCAAVVASGELSQALQLAGDLSRSKLLPVAVLLSTGMANNWQLAVWFEGFEDTVARQVREVEAMARRISMSAATPDHQNIQHAWNDVRDFPLQRNRLTYRVTVPRASVAEVIQLVQSWRADAADPAIIADIPIGTVWIALDTSQKSAGRFSDLTSLAQRHHGHAVMFAAPPQLKQGIEVWGPSPPTLSLMREIKQRFDPQRLLNPGRLAGNL